LTVEFPIGERHRQHRPAGRQRRLQQRGVEVQQATAIARRPFRKDRHMLALGEYPGNLVVDDPGVAPAATAQKDRVILGGQPADHRPAPHLFLRHESRRQCGIDDEDIHP